MFLLSLLWEIFVIYWRKKTIESFICIGVSNQLFKNTSLSTSDKYFKFDWIIQDISVQPGGHGVH